LHELRHKHVPGLKARGKLYDLRQHVAWQTLHEIKHWLTRHAEISNRIGKLSSRVGRNRECLDDARAEHWWVIDDWIDGPSLEEVLSKGPLKSDRAVALMLEVAEVLQLLHREGLVYRVLAPRSIYVTQDGAVISDFEMTKMAEGALTVAPRDRWPQRDVFIAPEVRDREPAKPTADLYSWAMVLASALYGTSPDGPTHARSIIQGAGLPGDIANFALACLEPKSKRPSLETLLKSHRPQGVNAR
jgi:serine/threonine protein kinase